MAELKDANTNPWYVLMTLYGEQEGDEVDEALAEKNRKVWNAWSCQGLNDEERARICANSEVEVAETRGWPKMKGEVSALHRVAMERRNGLSRCPRNWRQVTLTNQFCASLVGLHVR